MRIVTSSVMSNSDVRKDTAMSLAAGEPVSMSGRKAGAVGKAPHSAALDHDISAGVGAITAGQATIRFDDRALKELNVRGLVMGSASGALIGAGVGMLLDQLRIAHPKSAFLLEAACAILGAGVGSGVGGDVFGEVEFYVTPKGYGVRIKGNKLRNSPAQ